LERDVKNGQKHGASDDEEARYFMRIEFLLPTGWPRRMQDRHEVRIGTSLELSSAGTVPRPGCSTPFKYGQTIPRTKRKFDELTYYAEHFNAVEINNTFYRSPFRAVTEWRPSVYVA
jgi:Protein of unknown function DUF72